MATLAPSATTRSEPAIPPGTTVAGLGLGEFGATLAYSLSAVFGAFYYLDVVGFFPWIVATLLLVVRLWQAVAQQLAASAVGRLQRRGLPVRRVLYTAGIATLLLGLLTFNVPGTTDHWLALFTWNLDGEGQLAYSAVALVLLVTAHAFLAAALGSLPARLTDAPVLRSWLAGGRALGSAFGTIFVVFVAAPMVASALTRAAQGTASPTAPALAFANPAGAFAAFGVICLLLTAAWCRETVPDAVLHTSPARALGQLRVNSALRALALATLLYGAALAAALTAGAVYARWVLGSVERLTGLVLVATLATLVATPFVPALLRRVGRRLVFQFSGLLLVLAGAALWLVPVQTAGSLGTGVVAADGVWAAYGVAAALINGALAACAEDAIAYGRWKASVRDAGAAHSALSLARTLGLAVGSAVAVYVLAWGGYESALPEGLAQSEGALRALVFASGPLVALFAVLAMLVFIRYPVSERLLGVIRADNERSKLTEAGVTAWQ